MKDEIRKYTSSKTDSGSGMASVNHAYLFIQVLEKHFSEEGLLTR